MKKPSRHQTRFVCTQAVLNGLLTNFNTPIESYLEDSKININESFCTQLYNLIYTHGELLTDILTQKIQTRNFHSLDQILKAILYCALAEMLYIQTHKKVIITEYVTITKRFISDNSYKFVHGVLDSLSHSTQQTKPLTNDSQSTA